MGEGLVIIILIGILVCVFASVIIGCTTYWEHLWIIAVVTAICVIATTIVCISFAKSYTEEEKSVPATVIKIESQAFESSVTYKIWANDKYGNTWEVNVDSIFYANTREGDSIIINYDHVHYWNTERNKVTTVVRGG